MYVQICIWGSKELALWITENYTGWAWLKDLKEHNHEEYKRVKSVEPVRICTNPAIGQSGSLFPKMLYFYEAAGEFLETQSIETGTLKQTVLDSLEYYFSVDDGYRERALERDNIQVYPYLSEESKDYLTVHNMELSDHMDVDAVLRLFYQQLDNLSKEHCYMTQLRAYNKNFDVCYQSLDVKNPRSMRDAPCENPVKIDLSWLGKRVLGYAAEELDDYLTIESDNNIVPISKAHQAIEVGDVDAQTISSLELYQQIQWFEPFNNTYHSLSVELFCEFCGWVMRLEPVETVSEVHFNWVEEKTV